MFKHYLQTALRNLWRFKYTALANTLCLTFGMSCLMLAYVVVCWLNQRDGSFVDPDQTYAVMMQVGAGRNDKEAMKTDSAPRAVIARLQADFPGLKAVTGIDLGYSGAMAISAGNKRYDASWMATAPEFLQIYSLPLLRSNASSLLQQPDGVLLNASLAERLFGTIDVLGKTVNVNEIAVLTVTGVYADIREPSNLKYGNKVPELIVTHTFSEMAGLGVGAKNRSAAMPAEIKEWSTYQLIYIRLPEDGSVTRQQVETQLSLYRSRFGSATELHLSLLPVNDLISYELKQGFGGTKFGPYVDSLIWLFSGIVLCVAIANYANLSAAQTAARGKEIGMRRLLGAGGRQVFWQCWLETVLLCCVAAVLAFLLLQLLQKISPGNARMSGLFSAIGSAWFNWRNFLLMVLAMIVGVSTLAAAYPAYLMGMLRPLDAVRAQAAAGGSSIASRLLVSVQFFAASFLLVVLIVVQWQHRELKRLALGEYGDQVVLINNYLKSDGPVRPFSTGAVNLDFDTLRTELLRYPQVQQVASLNISLWMSAITGPQVMRAPEQADSIGYAPYVVSADFFKTLGIALVAGRYLNDAEDSMAVVSDKARQDKEKSGSSDTTVVFATHVIMDRQLVEKLGWTNPGQAIDQLVYLKGNGMSVSAKDGAVRKVPLARLRIVGVVENRPLSRTGAGSAFSVFQLKENVANFGSGSYAIVKLDRNDLTGGLQAIDDVWKKLAPNVALKRLFADEVFEQAYATSKLIFTALQVLAMLALAIAIMGMVGMTIHTLDRRLHEIGVRKSLGASTLRILGMLLRDFSIPVLVANLVAWPVAYVALRSYLNEFVYRVTLNPWPFLASLVITVIVAWLAIVFLIAKVARLNPAQVLRYE